MFEHLISPAPSGLSASEKALYEQRRARCLWLLAQQAAEIPDYVPSEYLLALYRGEVAGRWTMEDVQAMLREHYAQLAAGHRQPLPTTRLEDPRRGYHQLGEGYAVTLIGAVYDAWRSCYESPATPVYGPHPPGQEPPPPAASTLPKSERARLIDEACAQLNAQEQQRFARRWPGRPYPAHQLIEADTFERAVLSSYLAREVSAHAATQLLATHGEKPGHWLSW